MIEILSHVITECLYAMEYTIRAIYRQNVREMADIPFGGGKLQTSVIDAESTFHMLQNTTKEDYSVPIIRMHAWNLVKPSKTETEADHPFSSSHICEISEGSTFSKNSETPEADESVIDGERFRILSEQEEGEEEEEDEDEREKEDGIKKKEDTGAKNPIVEQTSCVSKSPDSNNNNHNDDCDDDKKAHHEHCDVLQSQTGENVTFPTEKSAAAANCKHEKRVVKISISEHKDESETEADPIAEQDTKTKKVFTILNKKRSRRERLQMLILERDQKREMDSMVKSIFFFFGLCFFFLIWFYFIMLCLEI